MMRILGIDPGTVNTGWGLIQVEGKKISLVESGVFHPNGKDRIAKLVQIYGFVADLVENFAPDIVAVEDTFFGKNVQSMIKLGEARTAAILAAALADVDVATFAPREVKMAVVGNGNAAKEQVAFMVKRLLNAPEDCPADQTDAIAVAFCWAQRALRVG
ncbi:MAG TPA: crossover junction endodeoxyribonuclease RuvC [candidate division Zixibacteria bacterium]|nr:crossover junction endodeoxyribonuclease RuvC [candidate division Zixibacteria bacterium]